MIPTGKGTSASHLTWSEDKFVEGEATIIELSGVNKKYHCPMARTVLLGKPDQKKIDTMKKTNEALQAGIDLVKEQIMIAAGQPISFKQKTKKIIENVERHRNSPPVDTKICSTGGSVDQGVCS